MPRNQSKNNRRNNNRNNQEPQLTSEDLAIMRKHAAIRLNAVGNDVRQLQKDYPNRWQPERRRKVNIDIKRLQFFFDDKDYKNVLDFSDIMVDDYQLTINRLKPARENKPREDRPREDRPREDRRNKSKREAQA